MISLRHSTFPRSIPHTAGNSFHYSPSSLHQSHNHSFPMLLRSGAARIARSLHHYPCEFRPVVSNFANMPLRAKLPGEQRKSMSTKEVKPPVDSPDDVLFHTNYGVRAIELNRPRKHNALSGYMAGRILERLREYEKSQLANIIIMKGAGGKALCAGGDVEILATQNFPDGVNPDPEGIRASAEYFKTEYTLDHLIATYTKPYVAFMDGYTIGGGVGLSVHAPFRIATEKTFFSMPETKIGFFTDVGGSFFLPRMDGELGTYLALTSNSLRGVDTLYAGIATHYLHSTSLPDLEQRLAELKFPDFATLQEKYEIVDSTIEEFNTGLPTTPFSITSQQRDLIDTCFSPKNLSGILAALETHRSTSHLIEEAHSAILTRCPLSTLATLALLRVGKAQGITSAFQHEAIVAARFMHSEEFYKGVTHLLINKIKEMPNWPGRSITALLADNETEAIKLLEKYVSIKPGVDERLEFGRGADYTRYPHWWIGLPSEEEIKGKIEEEGRKKSGGMTKKEEFVSWFVESRRGKEGVKWKVEECLERKTVVGEEGKLQWVYGEDRFA